METIEEWAEALKKSNKFIIVEGKKDKQALEQLGIKKIITFSNSPHFSIENLSEKEVVILTDLDKHGKKLYSILKHNLQARGIKIDKQFREFLYKETRIRNIETLRRIPIGTGKDKSKHIPKNENLNKIKSAYF